MSFQNDGIPNGAINLSRQTLHGQELGIGIVAVDDVVHGPPNRAEEHCVIKRRLQENE